MKVTSPWDKMNFYWVNHAYNLTDKPANVERMSDEMMQFVIRYVLEGRNVVDKIRSLYGRNLFYVYNPCIPGKDETPLDVMESSLLDFMGVNAPKTILGLCGYKPERMIRCLTLHVYRKWDHTIDVEFMRPIFYQRMLDPLKGIDACCSARRMTVYMEHGVPTSVSLLWDHVFYEDHFDEGEINLQVRHKIEPDGALVFDEKWTVKDINPDVIHGGTLTPSFHFPSYGVSAFIRYRVKELLEKFKIYDAIKKDMDGVTVGGIGICQEDYSGDWPGWKAFLHLCFIESDFQREMKVDPNAQFASILDDNDDLQGIIEDVLLYYHSVLRQNELRILFKRPVYFYISKDGNRLAFCRELRLGYGPGCDENNPKVDFACLIPDCEFKDCHLNDEFYKRDDMKKGYIRHVLTSNYNLDSVEWPFDRPGWNYTYQQENQLDMPKETDNANPTQSEPPKS